MDELELTQALRSLATANPAMPGAAAIEARLLSAFDAHHRPRTPWLPALTLAIAASLGAIGFVRDVSSRHRAPARAEDVFIAIPYTFPPAPYERTTVVRMNVPVAALVAAGFDVQASDAGAFIPADVLFGQDDRAVAIRPLTSSIP